MPTTYQPVDNFKLDHDRLITLINSITDAVIAIDENKKIVLYNAAALNTLDLNIVINDFPIAELLKLYDKDKHPVDVNSLIDTIKTPFSSRDYLIHYQDDRKANLYINISPVRLSYGQEGENGFMLVLRDITDEKSMEEERDEFISVISHELRTPVTIAEGDLSNVRFVIDSNPEVKLVKQIVNNAYKQVAYLAELINDLSTLSRAERKNLRLDVSPIDPLTLINGLISNLHSEAAEKGIEIRTGIDKNIHTFYSNQLYVEEILENFLTNAIKYTQQGFIIIGAKRQPKGTEFWVSDTGIGISKTNQEKIFDKFFRAEDYRTSQTKGTGLGLYIAKKLTLLLGGEIFFKSELNVGSTFTIILPDITR
jgi:two-component system phosphate regulon sensor histidine kinase PhoR